MAEFKQYKIYKILLIPENDRVIYVGMTSLHPAVRLYDLKNNNPRFKELVEKYGEDCMHCKFIDYADTKKEAFEKEAYWTEYYMQDNELLNLGIGSNNTACRTKEEMRDFFNNTLYVWLQNHDHPNKGRPIPEEERLKHQHNKRNRRVRCIETGEEYFSPSEAHRQTGISITSIWNACRGTYMTAGGYHWKYVDEKEES